MFINFSSPSLLCLIPLQFYWMIQWLNFLLAITIFTCFYFCSIDSRRCGTTFSVSCLFCSLPMAGAVRLFQLNSPIVAAILSGISTDSSSSLWKIAASRSREFMVLFWVWFLHDHCVSFFPLRPNRSALFILYCFNFRFSLY